MKVIKEFKRPHLIIDIMLYFVYVLVGYLLIKFPQVEELRPIEYAPVIFFTLGFFSLLSYFSNRRPHNYEYLFLGLINIITGAYISFYSYFDDTGFILGNAILLYSLCLILNKGYHTIVLSREKNINMFAKASITIILVLLGFLVLTNLFNNTTMQTLILGFYFLSFGLLSILEIAFIIVINTKKVKVYFESLIKEENSKVTLEKIKTKKTKKIVK